MAEIMFNLTSKKWGLLHSSNYGTACAAVLGYGTDEQYTCFAEGYIRWEDGARISVKAIWSKSRANLCNVKHTLQKQIISDLDTRFPTTTNRTIYIQYL